MRHILYNIRRSTVLLVLLITGWVAGCPLSAQTLVELAPDPTLTYGTEVKSLTDEYYGLTFTFEQNNGTSPKYYSNAVRLYSSNTVTMTAAEGYVVTKVEFLTQKYNNNASTLSVDNGTINYDSNSYIYTWENGSNAATATFTVNGRQLRVETIKVYLDVSDSFKSKPRRPVLSHDSGEFYKPFKLVLTDINNPATTMR